MSDGRRHAGVADKELQIIRSELVYKGVKYSYTIVRKRRQKNGSKIIGEEMRRQILIICQSVKITHRVRQECVQTLQSSEMLCRVDW